MRFTTYLILDDDLLKNRIEPYRVMPDESSCIRLYLLDVNTYIFWYVIVVAFLVDPFRITYERDTSMTREETSVRKFEVSYPKRTFIILVPNRCTLLQAFQDLDTDYKLIFFFFKQCTIYYIISNARYYYNRNRCHNNTQTTILIELT